MPVAIITGAGGLIGSEAVEHFVAEGFDVVGIENDMRAQLLRPRVLDLPRHRAPRRRARRVPLGERRHPRRATRSSGSSPSTPARSSWSSTPPPSPPTTGPPATRRPTSASTPTAPSTCSRPTRAHCPTAPFIFCSTNKVYGDTPNRLPLDELEKRLELPESHPYYGGIDTSMSIDASHPLAVRRLQGGGRPAGAGVRPLLRDADRLLPRRLPDRAPARRRQAARLPRLPDEVHRHRHPLHGLRLRGQAGPRQHPQRRPDRRLRRLPPGAARGRGLQHRRRPLLATARCSRRSTSASGSPAAS